MMRRRRDRAIRDGKEPRDRFHAMTRGAIADSAFRRHDLHISARSDGKRISGHDAPFRAPLASRVVDGSGDETRRRGEISRGSRKSLDGGPCWSRTSDQWIKSSKRKKARLGFSTTCRDARCIPCTTIHDCAQLIHAKLTQRLTPADSARRSRSARADERHLRQATSSATCTCLPMAVAISTSASGESEGRYSLNDPEHRPAADGVRGQQTQGA